MECIPRIIFLNWRLEPNLRVNGPGRATRQDEAGRMLGEGGVLCLSSLEPKSLARLPDCIWAKRLVATIVEPVATQCGSRGNVVLCRATVGVAAV